MNDGCAEPGCYEDQVTYSHNMDQIKSIINRSTEALVLKLVFYQVLIEMKKSTI